MPPGGPPGCAYAAGFLEALYAVCRVGRTERAARMEAAQRRQEREQLALLCSDREWMCDKNLSLDGREPFLQECELEGDGEGCAAPEPGGEAPPGSEEG